MTLDLDEALRYLGVPADPDGQLRQRLIPLAQELQRRIMPRCTWVAAAVDSLALPGQMAAQLLAQCTRAAVMCCTLGQGFDLWLRRLQMRDMSTAVLLDALGSVYVEAACDQVEMDIRARFPGLYLTDRFSPGYGDLPLDVQPRLMALARGERIGVTVTPSLLMNPQKSVTAVVGISNAPQKAQIRGCDHCTMKESCNLRKAGTPCVL